MAVGGLKRSSPRPPAAAAVCAPGGGDGAGRREAPGRDFSESGGRRGWWRRVREPSNNSGMSRTRGAANCGNSLSRAGNAIKAVKAELGLAP